MIPPIENEVKSVKTGSSIRENLISIQDKPKTNFNLNSFLNDLDIRKNSGEISIKDML